MDCRTQLASLAIEELDKGDFLMATKILTTGIRLEPNNHELYFERSICHHKLGDYQASLDDANAAIRLNSTDYNIHYQKGLALIGLSMFSEAVTSFKKAIELRAKQDDSKLSDIFRLLRDAGNEIAAARQALRSGANSSNTNTNNNNNHNNSNHQARSETVLMQGNNRVGATVLTTGPRTSNDPVDSTTDRPTNQPGPSSSLAQAPMGNLLKPGNSLVGTANRNNQTINSDTSQMLNGAGIVANRVSSSANLMKNCHMSSMNVSPDISGINVDASSLSTDLLQGNSSNQHIDQARAAQQFEWNIRRSERIFLHHSTEPGQTGPQYGILPPTVISHNQRPKTNSNPSSVNSGRSATKRPHDNSGFQTYQQANKLDRSREGAASSHAESDVDVDDSYNNISNNNNSSSNTSHSATACDPRDSIEVSRKRVMVAPSSSMPATAKGPPASTSKDDSYSSKYKRLRRDRERARRGTSKLCTIKLGDFDELREPINGGAEKRFMRVIAPVDGWLYSGQLSVDDKCGNNGAPQYVVKLDGDATGNSYLFSQETVLNDVIKEVRVKSVSELRKGARICCYWSRQYKCLSTGVVTSRTFEATKSLVSVKYDNGDLSAVPLDDLRLLPPDYPKYMSNCDPLLLARNGDGGHVSASMPAIVSSDVNRFEVESKPTICLPIANQEIGIVSCGETANTSAQATSDLVDEESQAVDNSVSECLTEDSAHLVSEDQERQALVEKEDEEGLEVEHVGRREDDDDTTIPPTDEVIDFITSDNTLKIQDSNQHDSSELVERISINTKDNIISTNTTQLDTNNSCSPPRPIVIYCPWMFDGPPKRSKRHGRTYRDNYTRIRRIHDVIEVGDAAELMPRDESMLPFIARIEGFWANSRGEMRVKVRWYYRLAETEGEPSKLIDGENALFETKHFDENDVHSIYRSTRILTWTDYCKNNLGHVNNNDVDTPKIFYLAGEYDPVHRIKDLRSDVEAAQ